MYEHLLVALDGSAAAERVLDYAEPLAIAFRSSVTLLRATISPEMLLAETANSGTGMGDVTSFIDPTPVVDEDRAAAIAYLDAIAARLRAHNLKVTSEHPEGPAADEIVERARALDASLILMTTHGRSGLGRVVFGSVADSVLRHAPCPVLMVRLPHETKDDSESA